MTPIHGIIRFQSCPAIKFGAQATDRDVSTLEPLQKKYFPRGPVPTVENSFVHKSEGAQFQRGGTDLSLEKQLTRDLSHAVACGGDALRAAPAASGVKPEWTGYFFQHLPNGVSAQDQSRLYARYNNAQWRHSFSKDTLLTRISHEMLPDRVMLVKLTLIPQTLGPLASDFLGEFRMNPT